jgi:hypothetical protein
MPDCRIDDRVRNRLVPDDAPVDEDVLRARVRLLGQRRDKPVSFRPPACAQFRRSLRSP